MQQPIWICFDLGLKGDYDSLYTWLDNHQAKECGESVAFLKYTYNQTGTLDLGNIIEKITEDLKTKINLNKDDRIYVIWQDPLGKTKGRFIQGKRKTPKWKGYSDIYEDSEPIDGL